MLETILRFIAVFVFLFVIISPAGHAQSPAPAGMGASQTAQANAKIVAIDHTTRTVTLQDSNGKLSDFQVGPNVKRFDELKVGDTITFTYTESVALKIVKSAMPMPSVTATPVMTSLPGSKPRGEITQTQVATVTIEAIDKTKPSVTVKTADGRHVTMLVQDQSNLNGVKVGDVVQITYNQALLIEVK